MEEYSVIRKTERESDFFVSKAMRVTALALLLIVILNVVGIFEITPGAMYLAGGIGILLLLVPTLLVNILKLEHPCLKWIFVTISIAFVSIMIVTLNWHAIVIFIYAIGIAGFYYSKALNRYALVGSLICFSIAQYFAYTTNLTTDHNPDSLPDSFLYSSQSAVFDWYLCDIHFSEQQAYQHAENHDGRRSPGKNDGKHECHAGEIKGSLPGAFQLC